ncbi:type IV secretory system conjugative DNA transfer family protein [Streptomyces triculaminicus]|uniref:type IV secretory system conjugative DNA transfer family protein n=1 Tax=Streptomyces triculaminicus TaxID=2816232 RepID=UPI0037D4CA25
MNSGGKPPSSRAGGDSLLVPLLVLTGAAALACTLLTAPLAAFLSGRGWPEWVYDDPATTAVMAIVRGPGSAYTPAPPAWLFWVLTILLFAAIGTIVLRVLGRRGKKPAGLAGRSELAGMLPKGAAERARQLRPALAGTKRLDPDDTGNLLGNLEPNGPELRSSFEDVELDLMAPRAGKSTGIAVPRVLRARGSVLLTSNKADVYSVTKAERTAVGTVWTFDPQGIAHTRREMWWDMLADASTIEGARRLAGHFVGAVNDDASKRDFWISAAQNTLTALFHAANQGKRQVTDVLAWLADPADRTPVDLLRDVGMVALAEQLQGTIRGAVETRDGIYETARQCVACLLDPKIAAWVTPDPHVAQFRPDAHALSRDTLYLLSKDGGGSAAGVIAAAADSVLRAGVTAAERMGGRLEPPMTAVLDEAANVCRISDLPDLYSHFGSRGINVVTLLQSYRQGSRVWGEAGMDALWGAATIKLLGAGLDDADFIEKVSRLVGEHDVKTMSYSKSEGNRSSSTSYRLQRVMPADRIRALPKGTALLLATGVKPALIRLRPWYKEPGADRIQAAAQAEVKAITVRATEGISHI